MIRIIFSILLLFFSINSNAEGKFNFEIGSEFESKNFSSAVLYHYKNDAIRVDMSKDLLSDSDFFLHNATVDARDLYKIKKGEKIKLLESIREGKIYKVKLLKENARRSHYYLISDNLTQFNLLNSDTQSS
ncbi:MAG: hypothetical protein VX720_00965 [Pseudomonadota bacterium]|nr:hypothetical protein [Pseudomonadota bacterium]|tara:strand:+ start:401 stop:793 length:393 start_codon:yes stop_codon:yes gene_type:complete